MVKNFFLYAFFCFQIVWGQTNNGESLKTNQSFQEGEWFQLRLHYGPFNASYATLSLERDTINEHPVYHAKGFGETTGLASWFFKVEDYYESYFDVETGLPYKFIRNINEAKDSNPEEKLYLTNIVLKDMINGAKLAVNQYYNKEVYAIKLDND